MCSMERGRPQRHAPPRKPATTVDVAPGWAGLAEHPPCIPPPPTHPTPQTPNPRLTLTLSPFSIGECAYRPELRDEIMAADKLWTKINQNRGDRHDPNRTFQDTADGEMWAEHEFLGDADYVGPTRTAVEGYSDDLDAPNPLGMAAGHHKIWVCFTRLLNRPRENRLFTGAYWLSAICLSSEQGRNEIRAIDHPCCLSHDSRRRN